MTDGNVRVAQNMQNAVARNVFTFMFKHLVTPVDKGAYTQVFASVAPEVRQHAELYKGAYLAPPAVISKPTKPGESPELAEELWNTTDGLLEEIGLTL